MSKKRIFSMNTVRICIDECGSMVSGRAYSKLWAIPLFFSDLGEMLLDMNRLFDECGYPQAFEELRSFRNKTNRGGPPGVPQPRMDDEKMERQRGSLYTFDVIVQSRRRAGWQGILMKPDRTVLAKFGSEMELLSAICAELAALPLTG